MKVRKISACLIGVMVLSVLGGCGKKSDDPVVRMREDYVKFVELGTYKGVEYTPQNTVITDEDIQSEIDSLISQNTVENQITEGIATYGDAVNIDYTGYIDGEAFDGGSTQGAGTQIELGNSGYIDNFDDQIVGHSPGDAFDVNVTFPDDYGSEDLAGKPAVFETTLNYIVEEVEPEYNDDLIATATDYTTTEEFEKATREHLEEDAAESDLAADKDAIFQKVIDSTTVKEYPETVVNDRIQGMMDDVTEAAEANGMDLQSYLANFGFDEESFKAQVSKSVESYIRERMIVTAIAVEEKIDVTDEEIEAKKQELMDQTGISDIEQLKQTYGYEEEDFYFEILQNKVIDFLYENAVAVEATNTDAEESDEESEGMIDDYGTEE